MSAMNSLVQNVGRAAYEMPDLLRRLGDPDGIAPLTEEQRQIADAVETHAYNATEAILNGLEAIGAVMSAAARSQDGIDQRNVADLADLVKHLAVEMQHLHDVESNMAGLKRMSSIAEKSAAPAPRQRTAART